MSATAPPASTMFDPASYDLEGTPTLGDLKATTIVLAFDSFELDHTDAEHMKLAGILEQGGSITLKVDAKPTKRSWNERPDNDTDRLGRQYKLTIRDITA